MTAFHDYEPLPLIPYGLAEPGQKAWRLIRELHAQKRISTVEAMEIMHALTDYPPKSSPISEVAPPLPRQVA